MKLTSVVVVAAMTVSIGSAHAGSLKDRRERKAGRTGVTTAASPSANRPVGNLRAHQAAPAPAPTPAPAQPRHVVLRGQIATSVKNAQRAAGTPVFRQHFDTAVGELDELYDEAVKAGDLDSLEAAKDQAIPLMRAYLDGTGKKIEGYHPTIQQMSMDALLREAGLYKVAYAR